MILEDTGREGNPIFGAATLPFDHPKAIFWPGPAESTLTSIPANAVGGMMTCRPELHMGNGLSSRDEEDVELLAGIARRDSDALLRLYRKYNRRVFSLVYRILDDSAAAEEVLQDTFYRLWDRSQLYQPEKGQLISWLFTVARNLALDHKRKESRRADSSVFLSGEESAEMDLDSLPAMASLEDPDLGRTISKAMEQLPAEQKKAIELAYFEGLTHQELSDKLGQSLGTVKTRIRLGLSKLREAMRDYGKVMML
jgi:RNA polymerase sigma-70 factor (ECF subfamily)